MERIITGLWLLAAGAGWSQGSEAPELAPPVYRYLILVEAGAGMVRQKDVAMDTVHQLILGGFNGRIRTGEMLGIWPFGKEVDRTFCRPVYWRPAEAHDLGNFVYRKLRDLEFARQGSLEAALRAVENEARHSERLTVFLVTSGSEPVRGTGFDEEINSVLRQHARGMAEAKRPFVTVLNYEGGRATSQAVTPGGMKIYIPPMPETVVSNTPLAEPVLSEPEPVAKPQVKPMTVSEISEKLRAAEAERREPEAVETVDAQHDPAAATPAQEPVLPDEPEGEEAQPASLPAAVVEVPAAEARTAEDRVTEPASATGTENQVAPSEPTPAESIPGDVGLAVESPKVEIPAPGPVDPEPSPARADEPAPSQVVGPPAEVDAEPTAAPAMVLPERPVRERLFYLGAGLGLLLAAALLVVWRFYRPRRRAHASVISQSMNRR